jgi:TatD DNase family protein
MFVDAHVHLNRYASTEAVLARAGRAGVVCVGMTESPADFDAWASVLGARRGVRLALGAHPLVADRLDHDELDRFTELAPGATYVGEVGLDGSREGRATIAAQRRVFEHVLNATGQRRCVLSVHSRGAEVEVIDALAEAQATAALHWYSGPLKAVDRALDAGLYFSVNTAMIGTQSGARLLRVVPHARVVTESDGPFATVARRVAEPADIPELVTRIAAAWGRDPDETAQRLWENMSQLAAGGARADTQQTLFTEAHG